MKKISSLCAIKNWTTFDNICFVLQDRRLLLHYFYEQGEVGN